MLIWMECVSSVYVVGPVVRMDVDALSVLCAGCAGVDGLCFVW
jgi:hypothetical protein